MLIALAGANFASSAKASLIFFSKGSRHQHHPASLLIARAGRFPAYCGTGNGLWSRSILNS